MAEWLVEEGIGEIRSLLIEGDRVLAARLHLPGELLAGQWLAAKLTTKQSGARRGVATLEDGTGVLVDHLPPEATEGSELEIEISRAPIAERGRFKLARARCKKVGRVPIDPKASVNVPDIRDLAFDGDRIEGFEPGQWEEIWSAASSGALQFAGGEIVLCTTPAMTVIDIDGNLPPRELALGAIPAIARAVEWFDLGGSIGIDFPTLEIKAERRKVDEALAEALADWPHERTAMNGFGFVQLVARLEGPSLLHRFATSRTGMCARYALRVAERAQGTGPVLLLTVHPALQAKLKPEWLDELARRTGKQVRIEIDPGLALEAPSAQILTA